MSRRAARLQEAAPASAPVESPEAPAESPEAPVESPETAAAPGSRRALRLAEAEAKLSQGDTTDYGRAGRNLPAAIGVGLLIGASVLAVLVFYPPAFLAVIVVAVMAALWELSNGLSRSGARVARLPTMVAGGCMVIATVLGGREALWVAFTAGSGAVLLWTIVERRQNAVKDVSLSIFALTYVGLMASFVAFMAGFERGNLLIIMFLATAIASDVGGYIAGVLMGRHPIAPRISPKKSWEGLAGSMLLAMTVGVLLAVFMLGELWWTGVVIGFLMPVFATLGDFSESMIKRDLRLKDMGTLLPGHGGVMDRLDSILPTAPVALLLFTLLPGYVTAAS